MSEIHKIVTLNINGMKKPTREKMLGNFKQKQEVDIILL
jgi:exonuclease III